MSRGRKAAGGGVSILRPLCEVNNHARLAIGASLESDARDKGPVIGLQDASQFRSRERLRGCLHEANYGATHI